MPTIKPRTGERLRRQQRMGRRIQAAREQKGVSLREAGEFFDRSHQWLHAVEKGDNGLDAIDAFDLADYLEVPFAYLVDDRYDQRRPLWPKSLPEWIALAGGDRELAERHWQLETTNSS